MKFGKEIKDYLNRRGFKEEGPDKEGKKKRPDKREREATKQKDVDERKKSESERLNEGDPEKEATSDEKKKNTKKRKSRKWGSGTVGKRDEPKYKKVKKSYPVKMSQKKEKDGAHIEKRQKFIDIHDNYPDTKQFYELKTKKRNVWRLKKRWDDALLFEVDDEFTKCRFGKNDEFAVFYKDDTRRDLKKAADPDVHPSLGYFGVRSISQELDILDDSNMEYLKTLCDELEIMEDGFRLEDKDIICITTSGNIVFIKLSRRHRSTITHEEWTKEHEETLLAATRIGRSNGRGKDKGGPAKKYITLGLKKDDQGPFVNEFEVDHDFVPQKFKTQDEEVAWMKERLWKFFTKLQEIGLQLVPEFDLSVFEKLREEEGLGNGCVNGGAGGYFTGMAMATEYWSPLHRDDDLFYTLLSCYCPSMKLKNKFKENILFYFCFPSINFAVPMRSTDVLLFNSAFPHCASNYRYSDCITFSLYASSTPIFAGMNMHSRDSTYDKEESEPPKKKSRRR